MKKFMIAMIESCWLALSRKKIARRNERLQLALFEQLRVEIKDAHQQWLAAINRFHYANGADQIDYAVYSMEATQKRYEMLIRSAKKHGYQSPVKIK